MRRWSPDKLGPICRAKLAAKRGLTVSPLTVTRAPYALVAGQGSLFDELEEQQ